MRSNVIVLLALLFPIATAAQVCIGNPAMGDNSAGNVGLGAVFFDGGKGYVGSGTFGSEFFWSGSLGYIDFDDTTLSLKTISGTAAYEVIAGTSSNISVCPNFGIGYGFGLEVLGIDVTSLTFSPGVAVGIEVEVSPTVSIAPFAQLSLVHVRLRADAGPTETDTSGALDLGVGAIFNERFSVAPVVLIPISSDGGDTSFGVSLSVAVGGG